MLTTFRNSTLRSPAEAGSSPSNSAVIRSASIYCLTRNMSCSFIRRTSIGFFMARASLVTAFFIPDRHTFSAPQFIHGIHRAFFVLGGMTLLSTIVFRELKRGDGDAVSQRKELHAE